MQIKVGKFHIPATAINLLISIFVSGLIALTSYNYITWVKTRNWYATDSLVLQWIEGLDHQLNDLKIRTAKKDFPNENVVLVTIDDAALKEIGRWPWNRNLMAQLTEQLFLFGTKAVGFDIVYSESETASPENDKKLTEAFEKNQAKIVLGAFSNDLLKVKPYQDYCVNEAFLKSGGANLVKLNPSFVVDDEGEHFDDINWQPLFEITFEALKKKTEIEYLAFHQKKVLNELTQFQNNALNAEILNAYFSYCQRWLTEQDEIWISQKDAISPIYQTAFDEKKFLMGKTIDERLASFKREVHEFPIWPFGEWQANIATLQDSAMYTASINVNLDNDGYMRRYATFFRSGNRMGTSFIPSLALQTYLAGSGFRAELKLSSSASSQKKIESLNIYDPSVEPEKLISSLPVDHSSNLLINYYGPKNSIQYVSARDLLNNDSFVTVSKRVEKESSNLTLTQNTVVAKKDFFKGKFVIVGVTANAVYDLRNTPVDINYPGAEIQATALSNFIQKDFLKTFEHEEIYLPILIILFGMASGLIISYFDALKIGLSLVVLTGSTFAIDKFIFEKFGIVYSSIFILIEGVFIFGCTGAFKYYFEERKKKEIKATFSKYVAPAIVEDLLLHSDNLKLGGRKQELTVFFSDIRGFSSFSEKMDPQELSLLLTTYLTPMTDVIFKNSGTLDKYMGDGIVAFFGAPIQHEDHAIHACRCALDSLKQLKILQEEFAKKHLPKIDIGIGINTGVVSVGNMGSQIVQSYTVIGDSVNLGARLEAANKDFGTRILISSFTYEKVKDHFVFRDIDMIRVKGKKQPVQVYELYGELADQEKKLRAEEFSSSVNLFRARNFDGAKLAFQKFVTANPEDLPGAIYLERCDEFINEPPPTNWDGVYDVKHK